MRIDLDLVRRVEHSAAGVAALQAAEVAQLSPDSAATAVPLDGGALVAFGPGRFVNRAMGLGLGGTPPAEVAAELVTFYAERGMPASLELSPWADPGLLEALVAGGYLLERFRNVYVHPLTGLPSEPDVPIVAIAPGSTMRHHILAGDAAPGSELRRVSDEFCEAAGRVDGAFDLVAIHEGVPAACGSLTVRDGVGWLGGAATLPAHRGIGLQRALIDQRLLLAVEQGCTLAAVTALPGGQSARNLERAGCALLYTQAVLTRPCR